MPAPEFTAAVGRAEELVPGDVILCDGRMLIIRAVFLPAAPQRERSVQVEGSWLGADLLQYPLERLYLRPRDFTAKVMGVLCECCCKRVPVSDSKLCAHCLTAHRCAPRVWAK